MATQYWFTPWGVQATNLSVDPFVIPTDWVEVSQAEFDVRLAVIQASPGAWKAAIAAAECATRKAAYLDLVACMPALTPATCSAMTGWKPGDC